MDKQCFEVYHILKHRNLENSYTNTKSKSKSVTPYGGGNKFCYLTIYHFTILYHPPSFGRGVVSKSPFIKKQKLQL